MIYDKTKWAGEQLISSWWAGGQLYKFFRKIDVCVGVESWDEALDWLINVEPTKKIEMIQFWGHGSPGAIYINGEVLNTNALRTNNPLYSKMIKVRSRLAKDATIWLRACSVFQGTRGAFFSKRWAQFFGCKIAAHTFVIGPWQSGLHTLVPGQEPYWPLDEGVAQDNGYSGSGSQMSGPFKPNTIFCLRGDIPKDW